MKVLSSSRSLSVSRALRLPVAMLLFFLPALLSAQSVPVRTTGLVGITSGVPPVYNGQYVLQMTEYGFFWLDTVALLGGHVQAISSCAPGFPTSDSGLYVIGDCNSITSVYSSGNSVLVIVSSGQCGAMKRGCGGPRDDGHWLFAFGLGTWEYQGDGVAIPQSRQGTDPLGRTWGIEPVDTTFRSFSWQVVGGGVPPTPTRTSTPAVTPTPTPTPTPGPATKATNLSSQVRADSLNYYGDKWRLQDISNPSPTRTDWDFNYNGSFLLDEGGAPGAPDNEGTVDGYFPCDPHGLALGNIRTGANCIQSLGLSNPPALGNYQFAMLSSVSASPFVPPAFQVSCPQVGIAGYAGFTGTCDKTSGTLTVPTGGSADPSISKGNLAESTFLWSFTFDTGDPFNVGPLSGPVPVPVPAGAKRFTLTITYPGGYQATAAGSVTIVDSVGLTVSLTGSGSGTVTSSPAGINCPTTCSATFPVATFVWLTGTAAPGSTFNGFAGCDSSIYGQCQMSMVSSKSVTARFDSSGPTPAPTSTPAPVGGSLTVSVTGPTSGSRNVPLGFTASASGGTGSYTYSWACAYIPSFPSFNAGSQTATCTYPTAGVYTVAARVVDSAGASAVSAGTTVTIAGLPAPSSQYTVSGPAVTFNLSGSYSASNGSPITFTANETNASSYAWDFGDGTFATTRSAVKTYTAAGSYTSRLTVAGDGTNTSGTASTTIPLQITGPPAPSTAYTVTGATQTGANAYTAEAGRAITFTATATQVSGYVWDFGDETKSGKSATKTYSAAGARTVHLTVTGDGTNTSGTANVDIAMTITPPSFRAVIVPGAAQLDDGTTTWGTDVSITNGGTASMNIGLAFIPLVADSVAPATLDLTQLNYGSPVALSSGASYSVSDVVAALNGGNNKGTLVIKYEPGTRAPLVSARVYFQPKVNPGNVSYGSGIPSYEVDGTGRISPQGFVSTALSESPIGLGTESEAAALDVALTVNMTGSGSGTVTSDPAGINCPTTCSATFPVATFVLLTGTAAPGSTFNGFAGCDSSIYGQCQMSMLSSKSVTARFDSSGPTPTPTPGPTNFTLTVTRAGTGSGTVSSAPAGISCGATCSATFAQATAVTLNAAPASGSTFSGWGGACSGTGNCSLTMSANQSATATFTAAAASPPPSGDQYLIGLRSDPRYRFVVTLFNAGAIQGDFELRATDDQGTSVLIPDASGGLVKSRKFNSLGPYQQVYLRDSDLGLDDGKHYVLTATATKGTLLAFGTALDKKTNDLVQISDDSQASPAENEIVSYWVTGVSRYDSSYGAHWRTDLRIFNRSNSTRNLYFEYLFTSDGLTERRAHVDKVPIAKGALLTYDDIIGSLLSQDSSVDLSGNTAGILRIYYGEDAESATLPLVIGSRNYDDEPTGTTGSQLAVYTGAQAAGPGQKLYLSGAEESNRYASRIGVFAMDAGPVSFRIVAVGPDGTEVGSFSTSLGGTAPHFGQISLTDARLNFSNPGKPVSIRIDQIGGGRVGAYAFTVDKVTLDTNFIQGLPQN